eukprot:5221137-Prymnesium_polylepis.1
MADDVARGGIGSLRAPCGASVVHVCRSLKHCRCDFGGDCVHRQCLRLRFRVVPVPLPQAFGGEQIGRVPTHPSR